MATQAERSASMRARWIEVGLDLFGRKGFEATSTTTLLEAAGASKGALYHHFSSKQALFQAVFERVSEDAIRRAVSRAAVGVARRGPPQRATDRLLDAALAWLEEVRRPEVARILLEDGPRVLGFERARDLEAATSLAVMRRGLEAAIAAAEIRVPDVDLMARLLNGVLAEAALIELRSDDAGTREAVERNLRALVEGLGD